MLGGLFKIAGTMAAWSASSAATMGVGKWITSRSKRLMSEYATHGAMNTRAGTRLARTVFTAITGTSNTMAHEAIVKNVISEGKSRIQNSYSSFLRGFTPRGLKNVAFLRQSVKNEALTLPMTYTMYRMEKHKAVTPEERDSVSSFRKYYIGTPMAFNIALGAGMDRMSKGVMQKATSMLARKVGATRLKAAFQPFYTSGGNKGKAIYAAGRTMNMVTEKLGAIARAKSMALEGHGALNMIGTLGPSALVKKVWDHYKRESIQVAGTDKYSILNRLLRDHESLTETYVQNAKRRVSLGEMKEVESVAYTRTMTNKITEVTGERVRKYRDKMLNDNKFTQFWNNTVKQLKDPSLLLQPETMKVDENWGKILDSKEVIPTGRYILGGKMTESGLLSGGTTIDFGALSLNRLKDLALRGATRGGVGTFLHLFGARNVLEARDSEHALIGAVTTAGGKSLNFPMAWYSQDGTYGAKDILAQMTGLHNYSSASASTKGKLDDFLDTQVKIYQKEYGIKNDRETLEKAFLASARHGELKMQADDMLVQMPGGKTKVIRMQDKGGLWQPIEIDIGGFNGELLEFAKFTRKHDSVPAKLIRSHTGYEQATYDKAGGGQVKVTHGPGMLGKIVDAVDSEEQRGLWYKLKNVLDIGYSQDRSVFSTIASIFRKHADPRYPTTFFSDDFIGSKEWRENSLRTDRSKEGMVSFFKGQAESMSLEYWTGLVRRTGGTEEAVATFKELGKKYSSYGLSGISDHMLTGLEDVGDAKGVMDSLLESLEAYGLEHNPDKLAKHFLYRDIQDLADIRRMFTAPTGKKVLDVMGHVASKNGTYYGGKFTKANKLDEYNSIVLRLQTAVMQSGDLAVPGPSTMRGVMRDLGSLPPILTNAERSAWYASSHMARVYHGLAQATSEASSEIAGKTAEGRIMSILDDVANVSGSTHKDVTKYYKNRKRFSAWAPWDMDSRLKWEDTQNVKTGIYMIPKKSNYGFVSREPFDLGQGEEISVAKGIMDASNISVMGMFHAFNRAASQMLGIGFDETNLSTPFQYFEKMLTQRVIPFTALYMGYSILDRVTDRLMDGTPFGEGLTVFGANILAGARVGAQGFLDITGATGIASRMEDLMPGIIASPASGIGRGIAPIGMGMSMGAKLGGPSGAITGGIIGSAVGMLLGGGPLGAFGMWDISKNRSEVIQELLGEKEVPVRKGRWWELSSSPFEGTRVQYYRPHIYALARSDYKEAPGFKDSMFTEVIGNMAPDWYAMKNYYTRPYPVTAGLFSNLPVFGNMLDLMSSASSMGRTASLRGIQMHKGEESPLYTQRLGEDSGISPEEVAQNFMDKEGYYSQTAGSAGSSVGALMSPSQGGGPIQPGTKANYTASPMMRSSFEWGLGESVENVKDIVGIRGFILGSAFGDMTGRNSLFDYAPQLASPVEMPGIQREYWDYELGGVLGMSEIVRRYINPKRGNMQMYNPIRNTMPPWLPGYNYYVDFQHGDPYTQVPMGEARLPGASYETLHDVDLTMPIVGDILGENAEKQAAYFLGIPNYMAERNRAVDIAKEVAINYREDAKRYGELLSEERTIYNVNLDTTATVDAIISRRQSGSYVPVKIVPKGFGGESNINAFLVMSGSETGILVEVNPETGGIAEKMVKRDVKRFVRDMKSAEGARVLAYNQITELENHGKSFNLANSYSWFNRYKILADVAHYSQEYKEAKSIVKKQIAAGKMPPEKIAEFEMTEEQVATKKKTFDFSEYRFKDLGEGLTPYTKARDAFIEEEYGEMEQVVGAMWEKGSHLRNPLQTKFYHNRDALEEYESNAIYGKTLKMWQNPYEDWIKTYALSAIGEDNPIQSSVNWATAGYLLGGGPLAALAAGAGGAFTSIMNMGGEAFIPERTLQTRETIAQADAVKYAKYMKMYQESGNEEFLSMANRTITGKSLEGDSLTAKKIGRSLGKPEKDYAEDIINNITRSNIARATQILPAPAVASIYHTMGQTGYAEDMMRQYSRDQKERYIPDMTSPIYSRDVPIEAPIISSFQQEGLNAHDAGYGWYSQMAQIDRLKSMGVYNGEGLYNEFGSKVSVKRFEKSLTQTESLRKALSRFGTNIQIHNDGSDRVEVELIAR